MKTFWYVLIILAVAGIFYMVMPKYQIQSVRVDDDTVVVTKVNTVTGKTTMNYKTQSNMINDYITNY